MADPTVGGASLTLEALARGALARAGGTADVAPVGRTAGVVPEVAGTGNVNGILAWSCREAEDGNIEDAPGRGNNGMIPPLNAQGMKAPTADAT